MKYVYVSSPINSNYGQYYGQSIDYAFGDGTFLQHAASRKKSVVQNVKQYSKKGQSASSKSKNYVGGKKDREWKQHQYISRHRGKNGNWVYEYYDDKDVDYIKETGEDYNLLDDKTMVIVQNPSGSNHGSMELRRYNRRNNEWETIDSAMVRINPEDLNVRLEELLRDNDD